MMQEDQRTSNASIASKDSSSLTSKNPIPIKVFTLRNWGLSLFLLGLFFLSILGQFFTGFKTYQEELVKYEISPLTVTYWDYFTSGHFISSVAENMESEFFQMVIFVYFTMCLYQIGSAESNRLPEQKTSSDKEEEAKEKEFGQIQKQKFPRLWNFYENSLTLTLLALFLISFIIHAIGSFKLINWENQAQNLPLIGFWDIFSEPEFWFESFQNWQSEFFSIAVMGLLSIFLRQKGSPQSKKMHDSFWKTGN